MNKGIIIAVGILGILIFAGIVAAVQMSKGISGYEIISGNFVEVERPLEKGWNLIYGLPSPDWISSGEIEPSNIKAIYGFDPVAKKYIRFYPNPDRNELSNSNVRVDTMLSTSAFWIYSDKDGNSKYMALQPAPIAQKKLIKGWNFLVFTKEDLEKYSVNELRGNCTIEKTFTYGGGFWDDETDRLKENPTSADWTSREKFPLRELKSIIPIVTFVVKVMDDCQLGILENDIPSVPTLPLAPAQ